MKNEFEIQERGVSFEALCEIGKDRIGDIENLSKQLKEKKL